MDKIRITILRSKLLFILTYGVMDKTEKGATITVDSEIFTRILLSGIAFKDILMM